MNDLIKLSKEELNKLTELNTEKFKAYQEITRLTHETNTKDSKWWNDIYKKHSLNVNNNYSLVVTKDGTTYIGRYWLY